MDLLFHLLYGLEVVDLFTRNADQRLIEGIMDGMVVRKRMDHLGQPTSLCDLEHCDVGLDDNWQACDDP